MIGLGILMPQTSGDGNGIGNISKNYKNMNPLKWSEMVSLVFQAAQSYRLEASIFVISVHVVQINVVGGSGNDRVSPCNSCLLT
jgi:hypothetical protein